jgi:anti-anti-sigma factor
VTATYQLSDELGLLLVFGELDMETAPGLARAVESAIGGSTGWSLVIDLSHCSFLDTTALGVLVDLQAAAREAGAELLLANTPPRIVRLLELTGLAEVPPQAESAGVERRVQTRTRAAEARARARGLVGEARDQLATAESLAAQAEEELRAAREKIENLQIALQTSRCIGQALGIIMEGLKVSEREAFDLMSKASQRKQVKLRDVAEMIVLTGELPGAA